MSSSLCALNILTLKETKSLSNTWLWDTAHHCFWKSHSSRVSKTERGMTVVFFCSKQLIDRYVLRLPASVFDAASLLCSLPLSTALIAHAQRNSNTTSLVQNGWWLIQWIWYDLLQAVSSQLGVIVNDVFLFNENTKKNKKTDLLLPISHFNFTSLNIQFLMYSDIRLHGQEHTLRTLREIVRHRKLKISWGKSLHKATTPLIMYTKKICQTRKIIRMKHV